MSLTIRNPRLNCKVGEQQRKIREIQRAYVMECVEAEEIYRREDEARGRNRGAGGREGHHRYYLR
jgi:hypothetical protein